ncbi:MAG: hypothetical protein HRU19_21810 [Pseudobacteriovorax sp.]|nr:hypothetical protein [Pseudobacteriovorax sp.]
MLTHSAIIFRFFLGVLLLTPLSLVYGNSLIDAVPTETCFIKGLEAPAGVCDLGEGLYVIGEFSAEKPTIIFIHGWIPTYELGVPDFVNAQGWQQEGFNTVIYRFIEDAFDEGEGETCRAVPGSVPVLGGVLQTSCPKFAEQRVWNAGGITDRFVDNYKTFFSDKPDYDKEIRFVGHSLGAQLVASTAFAVHKEPTISVKPKRVELIDPYVGDEAFGTGLIRGALSPYYPTEILENSECLDAEVRTVYCAVENCLLWLKSRRVGIAIYGSVSSQFFSYDLRDNFNYQEFSNNWLCSKSLFGDSPQCLAPSFSVVTAKHFFPLFSYFWSINEAIPENGISARTPTENLITQKIYRKQRSKGNWCNLERSIPFWEEGGLNHVFGISRYDGSIGRGYQDTTDSIDDFAERLVKYLGFNRNDAIQCGKAISLSNDTFTD